MKFIKKCLASLLFLASIFLISECKNQETNDKIRFVTSSDYPPFEYNVNGI